MAGTIELWLADIRTLSRREGECMARITRERRTEAERCRQPEDRLRRAAAGLLLRRVLGVGSEDDVRRGEHGKPELTIPGPRFNLSHGGNYAVLAVFHADVGVDIEPADRMPRRIPHRFLQPDEAAWLEAGHTPERFAHLWTRVESALKADGRGLAMGRRDFSVLNSGQPWHLHTFQWDGHVISCAAGEEFEVRVHTLSAEELLDE